MLATQSLFRLKKKSPCDLLPSPMLHKARVTWPKKWMAIMNRPLYNLRAERFWMFESPFEHYGRRVSWYYKMYLDCRVWDITSIYTLCVVTSVQAQPFRNLINSHKQFENPLSVIKCNIGQRTAFHLKNIEYIKIKKVLCHQFYRLQKKCINKC